MSEVKTLLKNYEELVCLAWEPNLSGAEKVWFVVYDPAQERRLRLNITEFETVTKKCKHGWKHLDLKDAFGRWMAEHKYKEAYFEEPDDMELALEDFEKAVAGQIKDLLTAPDVDDTTVVAISGLASLFGLVLASDVFSHVTSSIRGRMLVFFPGRYEGSTYRLLDARAGWNYLAVPITAKSGR